MAIIFCMTRNYFDILLKLEYDLYLYIFLNNKKQRVYKYVAYIVCAACSNTYAYTQRNAFKYRNSEETVQLPAIIQISLSDFCLQNINLLTC